MVVYKFTLVVVLPALVVEAVGDLVAYHPPDPPVVHVGRTPRLEKITLKKKLYIVYLMK